VLVGTWLRWNPFVVVLILVAAGPLTQLLATLWLFTRVAPGLRPHPRVASVALVRRLFRLGGLFLVLSIALVLATSLDNLVLAHSAGLAAVTAFAIPAKVFAQLGQAITLVNLPLWAAHGDAMARGDTDWVRRTTRRMVVLSAGAAALAALLAVFAGPPLIHLWLGRHVELPVTVLLGLAFAALVSSALSPLFMVQNAAGVIKTQILGWGLFALVTLPAKYMATSEWGYEVLPWLTFVGLVIFVAPPCVRSARDVVRSFGNEVPA
jgi:O-antigen/teichoic acid export membrane protein